MIHDDAQLIDLADIAPEFHPESEAAAKELVFTLDEFLALNIPPLKYHIEGILPERGKMTVSATAKLGKSFIAIQFGIAAAAGDCQFLGWRFGPPARCFYLQAEISDALLQQRLRWHRQTMPGEIDRDRAGRNFSLRSLERGALNLNSDEGKLALEAILMTRSPEILIVDPLCFTFIGLEENDAAEMGRALGYFSELTARFKLAVVVVHHHNKSGTSRGSSVFEGWPESDLQITYADPNIRDVAVVTGRLRCAYNSGPWFWRLPTPETPWIERMPDDYAPEKQGRGCKVPKSIAQTVLRGAKSSLTHSDLVQGIINAMDGDCHASTAKRRINEALVAGRILLAAGRYTWLNPEEGSKGSKGSNEF